MTREKEALPRIEEGTRISVEEFLDPDFFQGMVVPRLRETLRHFTNEVEGTVCCRGAAGEKLDYLRHSFSEMPLCRV